MLLALSGQKKAPHGGAARTNALVWHGTSMMYAVKYNRIISLVFSGVLLPVTLI
jgi:hypothetical protein